MFSHSVNYKVEKKCFYEVHHELQSVTSITKKKEKRCSKKVHEILQNVEKLYDKGWHHNTHVSPHKKWSFPLRIFSVNVTKSTGNCGFGHIYWRNPSWKTSFFCAVFLRISLISLLFCQFFFICFFIAMILLLFL